MLHLSSGVRLDGDDEIVFRQVDLEEAGGDGLYAADLEESTGLSAQQVRQALANLVDSEVLVATTTDDQLGARYVKGRAV